MTEGQALLTRVAMSVLAFSRKLAISTGETKPAIHLPNINGKAIQFVPFPSIPPFKFRHCLSIRFLGFL